LRFVADGGAAETLVALARFIAMTDTNPVRKLPSVERAITRTCV
jgi:hypothetical protein